MDQRSVETPGAAQESLARPAGASVRGVLAVFTLTTFLSALLLFSVQPLFAKMVLPLLGGAPSVWAVALLFFQGALLAGYAYAHYLIRHLPAGQTGFVHIGLSLLAFLSLPIALPGGWSEPPTTDPYFWQLGLFTVAIGLPFVAVSANAPLLQAWFARSGHPSSHDPYFLYAASNLGSLLALLSFPFILEPVFGLSALSTIWTAGYAALVASLALSFWMMRGSLSDPAVSAESPIAGDLAPGAVGAPGWRDRLRWIGLSLVPSALLTAFTTHVATDVASAPLIWVMPLALYLLSFVVVFRERALVAPRILLIVHLAAVALALLQLSQTKHETWPLTASLGVAAFFTSALVAHRTLYDARPAAPYLTDFYLSMSVGGVLGGLFAALLAPKLFSEVLEYPLLLAATVACRPGALKIDWQDRNEMTRLALILAAGGLVLVMVPWIAKTLDLGFRGWGETPVIMLAFVAAILAFWTYPVRQLAVAVLMFLAVGLLPSGVHRGQAQRSYFGVYRVIVSDGGEFNVLQHGTTLHGAQRIRDEHGRPVTTPRPVTYYHAHSPMASAIRVTGMRLASLGQSGRYGVIGLGAGSLACHSASGEAWRFFEIDPVVVAIAKSPHFTYLSTCQPKADIVLGDARLTLAKEKDESFDLLIVDAFSSDAIPMHLLTKEAIEVYAAKLKPQGIGVLHISNRYLDLEAVLGATIPETKGLKGLVIQDQSTDQGYAVTRSTVVVFGKDYTVIDVFRAAPGARDLPKSPLKPWTDDASDVLGPLFSKLTKPK